MYSNKLPYSADLSWDALQAFDQIYWEFMLRNLALVTDSWLLQKCSMHIVEYSQTIKNILNFYYIVVPGRAVVTPKFFALALEPLAIAIRAMPQIAGFKYNTSECTIGLYADDAILTLSVIWLSMTPLLEVIKEFGQFSGFTIKWEKSVLMPVSDGLDKNALINISF